jgi:hypothetical protein
VAYRQGPTLVVNPGDDDRFRRDVSRALLAGARTPDALARDLVDAYPSIVVRRRDLSDEANEVWYVYRDGSWRSGSSRNLARDDFRATSESLAEDARRVHDIEVRSAAMEDADPQLAALAQESYDLTRDMATKSAHQAELLREARDRAGGDE